MHSAFEIAALGLGEINQQFQAGEISSMAHRNARESALAAALNAIADENHVALKQPLQIDSRGDFSLVCEARPDEGIFSRYGAPFAALLTKHGARCGVQSGAHIEANASWCWMQHFSVERLINDYAQQTAEDHIEALETPSSNDTPRSVG